MDSWAGWNDPYTPPPAPPRPQRPPAAVLGPPYGIWEILGMETGTTIGLAKATNRQYFAAKKGKSLASYNAETHPSKMYQGPTNDIGAYYRSAFWLAVGARVLIGRGEKQKAERFIKQADQDRRAAAKAAGHFPGFGPGSSKSAAIMEKAGRRALNAGLPSIAKVLGVLPTRIKFAKGIREQRGLEKALPDALLKTAQLKRLSGKRPWWLWPVVGGVGLLAVALIVRPYFDAAREATQRRR